MTNPTVSTPTTSPDKLEQLARIAIGAELHHRHEEAARYLARLTDHAHAAAAMAVADRMPDDPPEVLAAALAGAALEAAAIAATALAVAPVGDVSDALQVLELALETALETSREVTL